MSFAAALSIHELRLRARTKFSRADRLWLGSPGFGNRPTNEAVSQHKARRFEGKVWDLCSGIGGDTLSLASHMRCHRHRPDPAAAYERNGMPRSMTSAPRVQTRNAGCPQSRKTRWTGSYRSRSDAQDRQAVFHELKTMSPILNFFRVLSGCACRGGRASSSAPPVISVASFPTWRNRVDQPQRRSAKESRPSGSVELAGRITVSRPRSCRRGENPGRTSHAGQGECVTAEKISVRPGVRR